MTPGITAGWGTIDDDDDDDDDDLIKGGSECKVKMPGEPSTQL